MRATDRIVDGSKYRIEDLIGAITLTTASEKLHIEALDVLRGVAASLVVLHHVLRTVPGLDSADLWYGEITTWMRHLFLGDAAVTLFFVLSGASLTISALSSRKPMSTRTFFVRRVFRIYPLYVLIIVIYYGFRTIYTTYLNAGLASEDTWLSGQFVNPTSTTVWLTHLTMTFNLVNVPVNFNNVLWSLPLEMQFYLLFPIMFLLAKQMQPRGAIGLVFLVFTLYTVERMLHTNIEFLERLWEFGGGVVLGIFWKPIWSLTHGRIGRILGIIAAFLSFELSRFPIAIGFLPGNFMVVINSFVIVIVAFGFAEWKSEGRLSTFMVKIGVWSYSLYLIHNLVLGAVTPILRSLSMSPLQYFLIALPIVYTIALLISSYLYRLIELPFMRLGSRIAQRFSRVNELSFAPSKR